MKKNISILGSTGSIGSSALSIIDKKKDYFKVIFLSSNKNYKVICKQILNYQPIYFIIFDKKIFLKTKKKFKKNKIKILNIFDELNLKKKNRYCNYCDSWSCRSLSNNFNNKKK